MYLDFHVHTSSIGFNLRITGTVPTEIKGGAIYSSVDRHNLDADLDTAFHFDCEPGSDFILLCDSSFLKGDFQTEPPQLPAFHDNEIRLLKIKRLRIRTADIKGCFVGDLVGRFSLG